MRVRILIVCLGFVGTFWAQIDTRISPAPSPAEQTPSETSSRWMGNRLTGFLGGELGSTLEQGMEATLAVAESETNQLPTFNHYGGSRISGTLSFHQDWSRASVLMQYAGGADLYINSKRHYQQLSAAEAFRAARWSFSLNQGFSYLPESSYGFYPTHGISSEVPLSTSDNPAEGPALFLPVNASEHTTSTQASAKYLVGVRSTLSFNGSFSDLRFTEVNSGIPLFDSQMFGSGAQYTYDLDRTTTIGAGYEFIQGRSLGFSSILKAHSVTGTFSRSFSRRLALHVSAGPQFATLNQLGTESVLGTSATFTVSVNYQIGQTMLGVSDFHGVNPGSGLLLASRVNDVQAAIERQFSPTLHASISVGYAQNDKIGASPPINAAQHFSTTYVAATGERYFNRLLSCFATYSIQNQTSDLSCNTSGCPIFNILQTATIGFRFHIRPLTLQP